jgi:hypothetical protein
MAARLQSRWGVFLSRCVFGQPWTGQLLQ